MDLLNTRKVFTRPQTQSLIIINRFILCPGGCDCIRKYITITDHNTIPSKLVASCLSEPFTLFQLLCHYFEGEQKYKRTIELPIYTNRTIEKLHSLNATNFFHTVNIYGNYVLGDLRSPHYVSTKTCIISSEWNTFHRYLYF